MWRDNIKKRRVYIRKKMKSKALEMGVFISPYVEEKIKWMETRGGHCFCEPDGSRHCPCGEISRDMREFNGGCLCNVFISKDKLERLNARTKKWS